jgi:hypothetical protein
MRQAFGCRTVHPRIFFHVDPTRSVDRSVTDEVPTRTRKSNRAAPPATKQPDGNSAKPVDIRIRKYSAYCPLLAAHGCDQTKHVARMRMYDSQRTTHSMSSRRRPGSITTKGCCRASLERRVPFTTPAVAYGSRPSPRRRCGRTRARTITAMLRKPRSSRVHR